MTEEKEKLQISVFFPCYNEQDNVAKTVGDTVKVLEELGGDYEIIIVDDGSSDRTAEISDGLSEKYSNVKVVHHERNLGYGAALQSGFKAASKPLVFYTDGDGQFDINEIRKLIPLIKDHDIVSGYRIKRQDNMIRRLNGFCWTRLVCLLFRLKVRDIDSAFKLYRRSIFDNIEMTSMGALIDAEILARAAAKGYTITEVAVTHYPRTAGEQTGANLKVILKAFIELFKLYMKIRTKN